MALNLPSYSSSSTAQNYTETARYLASSAEAIANEAERFLGQLESNNIDLNVGDMPEFNSVVWLGSLSGLGDRPTRPTVAVPNYASIADRLAALIPPDAPTGDIDYTDPGYSSMLRDPFLAKLLDDMTNGGYGIEPLDEAALWTRVRDREERAAQNNVMEARRQASYSGFPMPQGALASAIAKARQESMSKVSSANRDIALKRADMYVENRRFILEKVLASEELTQNLYNAIQDRTLKVLQTEIQLAISLFDAGVKYFTAQQEALLKQVEAGVENSKLTLQAYNADVQAYTAYVNAVVSAAQITVANSRNVLNRDIASLQARQEQVRFRLEQLRLTTENSKDVNKYGTEFYRTALGSVMNGINGLAVQTGEA